jgi:hypothetical protein
MTIQSILAQLDADIARLVQAKAILSGSTTITGQRGRPRKDAAPTPAKPAKKKKRNLSPEGRARIAAAVKARWARQKKGK